MRCAFPPYDLHLKKGDFGGFKNLKGEGIYGKGYMCAPWLRADPQVRPYIKYPVDLDLALYKDALKRLMNIYVILNGT